MPYPTQPSLTLAATTATSFTAQVSGGDAPDTMRLFYRKVGAARDTQGPSRVGNGVFTAVGGLDVNGEYVAWCVADDGSSYSLPAYAYVSLQQSDLLSAAVQSLFASSPTLINAVPGGLWTGEVPEGTLPPYGWLEIDGAASTPTFEEQFERCRFTAHLYAVGAAAAEAAALAMKGAFDYKSLPFVTATTTTVQLVPVSYRLRCEAVRWKDQRLVYRASLTYLADVQRARALS